MNKVELILVNADKFMKGHTVIERHIVDIGVGSKDSGLLADIVGIFRPYNSVVDELANDIDMYRHIYRFVMGEITGDVYDDTLSVTYLGNPNYVLIRNSMNPGISSQDSIGLYNVVRKDRGVKTLYSDVVPSMPTYMLARHILSHTKDPNAYKLVGEMANVLDDAKRDTLSGHPHMATFYDGFGNATMEFIISFLTLPIGIMGGR